MKSPNPEEPAALELALRKARDVDADILLGTDPDADRVGVAIKNDKGEFWVTIAYIVKTESDDIKLSFEHDEFRWFSPKEFLELESPNKIRRFINNLTRSGDRDA